MIFQFISDNGRVLDIGNILVKETDMGSIEIKFTRRDGYRLGTYNVDIEEGVITIPQLNAREFDLSSLSSLTELKELVIDHNPFEKLDLSPLATCQNLESLIIKGSGDADLVLRDLDLSPLKHCKSLRVLSIHSISIGYIDFSFLSDCVNFEALSLLRINNLEKLNFSILSACQKFRRLEIQYLYDLKEIDIQTIANNTMLEELIISHLPLLEEINLDPLENLSNLLNLVISDNSELKVLDIKPIESCQKLSVLIISNNPLLSSLDQRTLQKIDTLQELHLDRNGFLCLDVGMPPSIKKLSITYDSSFPKILRAKSLEAVSIINSTFDKIDLSPLEELTQLLHLTLKGLKFTGVLSLCIPPKLQSLHIQDIYGTHGVDISSLSKSSISKLFLYNLTVNDYINLEVIGNCPNLSELRMNDIFGSGVQNFSSIGNLPSLETLEINNVRFRDKFHSRVLVDVSSLGKVKLGYFPGKYIVDHSALCLSNSLYWIDIHAKWRCDSFAWSILLSHGKRIAPEIIRTGGVSSPYAMEFIERFGWQGLIDKITEAKDYWNLELFRHELEILDGLGIPIPDIPEHRFLDILKGIDVSLSFSKGLIAIENRIVEILRAKFKEGFSTVLIDLDEISKSGLAVLIPEILDARVNEIENTVLYTGGGLVDILPLACTAFGYAIIRAHKMEQEVAKEDISIIQKEFDRIGIELKTTEKRDQVKSVSISDELKERVRSLFSTWAYSDSRINDDELHI